MPPSNEDKAVYRHASSVFGTEGRVITHGDKDGAHRVSILACADTPWKGVMSYSTVNLSGALRQMETADGVPFGVELCGACETDCETYPDIIATCALCALTDNWALMPDVVHPRVIEMYNVSATMKHMLLSSPFFWGDGFGQLRHDDYLTVWLQCVPISDAELDFYKEFGAEQLKDRLEQADADVVNIHRPCIFNNNTI